MTPQVQKILLHNDVERGDLLQTLNKHSTKPAAHKLSIECTLTSMTHEIPGYYKVYVLIFNNTETLPGRELCLFLSTQPVMIKY